MLELRFTASSLISILWIEISEILRHHILLNVLRLLIVGIVVAECVGDRVSGFHNIKLIQSKHQLPNLKKLLTKAEYGEVLSDTFNCSDKRCECCNYLLINDHYTFKNVQITFKLKNRFTCDSFNLIYVAICVKCKGEGKT